MDRYKYRVVKQIFLSENLETLINSINNVQCLLMGYLINAGSSPFQYFRATPEPHRINCSVRSGIKEIVEVETGISVTILQEDCRNS